MELTGRKIGVFIENLSKYNVMLVASAVHRDTVAQRILIFSFFCLCLPIAACKKTPVSVYYGSYSEPCGRSMLKMSASPDGPFKLYQPTGKNSPTRRLRYHTLRTGRFKMWGRLTGKNIDDNHCGSYPEFIVDEFEPWGKVKRCTNIGSLGGAVYTDGLSTDRYVPTDYENGPKLKFVDDDSCIESSKPCISGLLRVTACNDKKLCCRLLK